MSESWSYFEEESSSDECDEPSGDDREDGTKRP
jgi:hypothetical protein